MTLVSSEDRIAHTADLLESVHNSIRSLRKQAEDLSHQIRAGDDVDLSVGARQMAAAEQLVKICQKVEASLVEQCEKRNGGAGRGATLDLGAARAEIGRRLACLRGG